MHLKILGVLYFIFGYVTSMLMIVNGSLYIFSFGWFLCIYLTFQIVEQLQE
jgi:hypothetical protein